jgi:anti-anti-sigma factor
MTGSFIRPGSFVVSVDFVGEQATLGVEGSLDGLALPGLGALFDAVIASGYPVILVDLSDLDYLSSAGLAVIARAAQRLAGVNGQLTVRSPSAAVRRLMDVTGLVGLTRPAPDSPSETDLGPEEMPATAGHRGEQAGPDLVHELHRVSAIASNDDVVDGALRMVVALARTTIAGADGVSVSLRRGGQLATVAATDQTISEMDASQYATGEGPCVSASVEGRWFHAESLDTETRWPAFTPKARALGINAILSSPLVAADRPVGAINIYSRTVAAFEHGDQRLASIFATEASVILTEAGMDLTEDERSARFQGALLTRQAIAVAQGVLMARRGISQDAAYTLLRVHSERTGQPLGARAADIAGSTVPPGSSRSEERHHD